MLLRKSLFALAVVLMIVLAATPLAFAQDFGGDKVVFGDNYLLSSGNVLDGNLAVLGGNATLQEGSIVRGDVTVLGGSLDASGEIQGNVAMFGGSAVFRSTAVVNGDLASFGGSVTREEGSVVKGNTFDGIRRPGLNLGQGNRPFSQQGGQTRNPVASFFGWQLGTIGLAILLSLLGAVLVLLAPRAMERLTTAISRQAALSFGVGLLTWILALLAGAILLIACGLGLLVWLVLGAAAILGWVAFALWLGWALFRALKVRTGSSLLEVVVGAFIVTFVTRVPWCGFLVSLIVGSIGLGAVVLTRFGTRDSDGTILAPRYRTPEPLGSGPATPAASAPSAVETRPEQAADIPWTVDSAPAPAAAAPSVGAAEEAVRPASDAYKLVGLTKIKGIDETIEAQLVGAGIVTIADVANSDVARLSELTGVPVGQIVAEDWIGQARRLM